MDLFGIVINTLPSVFSVIVLSYIVTLFLKSKSNRKYGKEKIYNLLTNHLEQNLVKDKIDIIVILNSISREYEYNYSLISILEDYIVYISKDETNNNLKDYYELLKNIILLENQEIPFNNVPDEEKRILININENIKNKDLDSIKFNIKELSSVISTKNIIYEKTQKANRWSIPIAIMGMICTIIFGIFGLK
jgi:hypothetical protein